MYMYIYIVSFNRKYKHTIIGKMFCIYSIMEKKKILIVMSIEY